MMEERSDLTSDATRPMVRLEQVTHVYVTDREASLAVENIDFSVETGEFVSLVGPSGCGKTTILSMIAGLLRPAAGLVMLQGQPVSGPSPEVGYMLQQDYLFPWRTIMENALLGLELANRVDEAAREQTRLLLEGMGLGGKEHLHPSQLSGECASAWRWYGRWRPIRDCCCWMSRSPRWIIKPSYSWKI